MLLVLLICFCSIVKVSSQIVLRRLPESNAQIKAGEFACFLVDRRLAKQIVLGLRVNGVGASAGGGDISVGRISGLGRTACRESSNAHTEGGSAAYSDSARPLENFVQVRFEFEASAEKTGLRRAHVMELYVHGEETAVWRHIYSLLALKFSNR